MLGVRCPKLDPAFERGAGDSATVARLNDPPTGEWLHDFTSDRIDGVFLLAGPDRNFVAIHESSLRQRLAVAVKVGYAETGTVRPGREKGHEHFGFADNVSQPGIRGLTRPSRPSTAPNQGVPGQPLVWPGEFLLGYPAQDAKHPDRPGPVVPVPASWAKNGSYMVFSPARAARPRVSPLCRGAGGAYRHLSRASGLSHGRALAQRRAAGADAARRQSLARRRPDA